MITPRADLPEWVSPFVPEAPSDKAMSVGGNAFSVFWSEHEAILEFVFYLDGGLIGFTTRVFHARGVDCIRDRAFPCMPEVWIAAGTEALRILRGEK